MDVKWNVFKSVKLSETEDASVLTWLLIKKYSFVDLKKLPSK